MKIGLVIHTQSGHTSEFARAIAAKFNSNGHDAEIDLIRTTGTVSPGARKFSLKNPPSVAEYEAVLFGGPVWAFKASPVIMTYLQQLKGLKNKKVMSFVCMGFPFPWMGGTQAIKAMDSELESSGGDVLEGEILHYAFKVNKEKMKSAVERIYSRFTGK
jgi:flavorubredoxin